MSYKIEHEQERLTCLECGQDMGYGRPNRKFCSNSCKNHFHNRQTHSSRAMKLKVINALERNYTILEKLIKLNITALERADVSQLGFRFDCVTSYHKVKGHDEYRCFDIKYYLTATKMYAISRTMTSLPVEENAPPTKNPKF